MSIAVRPSVSFNFHADPGHGWLEVSAENLAEVGLKPTSFSSFSYRRGSKYFLEEDADAGLFIAAFERMFPNVSLKYIEHFSDNRSFVRDLERIDFINRM